MIGARTVALLCLVGGALALPYSFQGYTCPEQNENSTEVIFANPANCSTFYECDNGEAKLLACPADLYFSSEKHVCVYKKDSDCASSEEVLFSATLDDGDTSGGTGGDDTSGGTGGDDTSGGTGGDDTSGGSSGDDVPDLDCPEEEDNTTSVYYPNLNNCSTFYECSNQRPVLLACPNKLYWSSKACVCTLPKRSGCTQPDDSDNGDDFKALVDVADVEIDMSDDWLEISEIIVRDSTGKCTKKKQ